MKAISHAQVRNLPATGRSRLQFRINGMHSLERSLALRPATSKPGHGSTKDSATGWTALLEEGESSRRESPAR